MPFTLYFDQQLITTWFGSGAASPPSNYYVGLSSAAPTVLEAGGTPWNFVEPAGNGYARVAIPPTGFAAVASEPTTSFIVANTSGIVFPVSTGAWAAGGVLGYGGIFDAMTSGNLLGFGALFPNSQTVPAAGYVVQLIAGQLQISQS